MEKKEIKVSYSKSGVKTLDGFGTFFMVIGVIAIIVAVIGFIVYLSNTGGYSWEERDAAVGITLASSFFPLAIGSFAGGAICKGLSSIAKTSLYQKMILEERYYFIDN